MSVEKIKYSFNAAKGLINSQFQLHTCDLIEQRLLPGNIGIPLGSKKYIPGINMLEIEFKDRCVGGNIF